MLGICIRLCLIVIILHKFNLNYILTIINVNLVMYECYFFKQYFQIRKLINIIVTYTINFILIK